MSGFLTFLGQQIPYAVLRSPKRKRTIAFKMNRDGSVQVLAPFSASLGVIEKILQKRASWILRQVSAQKPEALAEEYTDGAFFSYLGHSCVLNVSQGAEKSGGCRLSRRAVHVHVRDAFLSPQGLKKEVELEIKLWLKKRAKVVFKRRLDLWAKKLGVSYKRLSITDPKRRWGSCSADNVIRLNWRLMMLPLPILDYVVGHELAHVRHKNHSLRFWRYLMQAMPDCQARRKVLRRLERELL